MWIIVAFDIPSDSSKEYRIVRKTLISNGFSQFQKSLYIRWVHSVEKMETLRSRISGTSPPGSLYFFHIPDNCFADTFHLLDGVQQKIPDPPNPWIVI